MIILTTDNYSMTLDLKWHNIYAMDICHWFMPSLRWKFKSTEALSIDPISYILCVWSFSFYFEPKINFKTFGKR